MYTDGMTRPWGLTPDIANRIPSSSPVTADMIDMSIDFGLDYLNVTDSNVDGWPAEMQRMFVNGAKYQSMMLANRSGTIIQRPVGVNSESANRVSVNFDARDITRVELAPMALVLWKRVKGMLNRTIEQRSKAARMRDLTIDNLPYLVSPKFIPADLERPTR